MNNKLFRKFPLLRDAFNLLMFVALVIAGTSFINAYVFRTFSVVGPSMEHTLITGDRLIVNRLVVTMAEIQNKSYIPDRCQVIVFKNPQYATMQRDENIVKRVIAFPGERISLIDGKYTVYNNEHPQGFNPDDCADNEPQSPTDGTVNNLTVPDGEIFVSGDNRIGNYSFDSRNGLGTVPLYDVIGPVVFRIYPLDKFRSF